MRIELIHPMIIHFPIVLLISLVFVDTIFVSRGDRLEAGSAVGNTSAVLALAAGVSAILAFMFGDQAYDVAVAAAKAPKDMLEIHQELGTFTAFAIAAWAAIRSGLWWKKVALGKGLAFSIVGVEFALTAAILATAWFGGELVYSYGVAVAS